jgi:hypothetical protein
LQAARSTALLAPWVIFRSGPDEFDTRLSELATQIGFRMARCWPS